MALSGQRSFVGFGFGPIQAGLFLHEAFLSGGFRHLVVAEVLPDAVQAVRQAEGRISINIARSNRVETVHFGPLEIEDPACPHDRTRLIEAVAGAEEIATALPSVNHYTSDAPGSVHRILAEGLRLKASLRGPRAIVYAAENHNHAAEILEQKVLGAVPDEERRPVSRRVRFLNTVIGKMSGVVTDPSELRQQSLAPITPALDRAFLVEEFNRIYISAVRFEPEPGLPAFRRGIGVFEEKKDLLPFEEAKLYGHNATHALAAYVGALRGVQRISDLRSYPGIMRFLRAAFIEESGAALIRRHVGVDPLFTDDGYKAYAEDLLTRMVNPYLLDTVERVGRDAARKLGWDDRLTGTVRVALREGVVPRRYALGIAAALAGEKRPAEAALDEIWKSSKPDPRERREVLELVEEAQMRLQDWVDGGFPDLEP